MRVFSGDAQSGTIVALSERKLKSGQVERDLVEVLFKVGEADPMPQRLPVAVMKLAPLSLKDIACGFFAHGWGRYRTLQPQ